MLRISSQFYFVKRTGEILYSERLEGIKGKEHAVFSCLWVSLNSLIFSFMMSPKKFLPGFKATCLLVGVLNILMAGSMLVKGVIPGMAQFKVPEQILASPHYEDAMFWVFLHMFMIGVLIILIGILAENPVKQVWVARVLVLMHGVYAFLDIRSSDNSFGNALYQGPESVIPVFVDLFYILLFLRLSFSKKDKKSVNLSMT